MKKLILAIVVAAFGAVHADSLLYTTFSGSKPVERSLTLTPGAFIRVNDSGVFTVESGTTFKASLSLSKADVGLGNVDNTSDSAKPISAATQAALNLKLSTSIGPALSVTSGTLNVVTGTTGTTVAAGDDARIVGAMQFSSAGQVIQNIEGLNRTFDDFMRFDVATDAAPQYLTFTGFSDSMPGNVGIWLVMDLAKKYGLGSLYNPEFGVSWNGATTVFSGGAAVDSSDYTITPGANLINIPAGGSISITTPNFNQSPGGMTYLPGGDIADARITASMNRLPLASGFRMVRIPYFLSASGTVTATVSQAQYSDVTATVTSSTATEGTIELTVTDRAAPLTLSVASSGTNVKVCTEFRLGSGGIGYWSAAKGSTKMDDQTPGLVSGTWNRRFAYLCSTLNTTAVIHAQRATDPGAEANNAFANYQLFLPAFAALSISQIVLAEPNRDTENPLATDTMNQFLQKLCASMRVTFVGRKFIVNPFTATALDWDGTGDSGVHRTAREYRYSVGMMLWGLNYFRPAAGNPTQTATPQERRPESLLRLAKTARFTPTAINSSGTSIVTATYSGTGAGWGNPRVDYRRGFSFSSTTYLGDQTAVLGQVSCGGSQFETQNNNISVILSGDRNLSLPRGTEALLTIGAGDVSDGNSWIKQKSSSAIRCYGVEFANGTDVGVGGTFGSSEHLRLWWRDASNIFTSAWVPCLDNPSGSGVNLIVEWNKVSGRLILWVGSNTAEVLPRVNVEATPLSANATSFNSIQFSLGARNTDWGNGAGASPTPSSSGRAQWRDITVEYSLPQ